MLKKLNKILSSSEESIQKNKIIIVFSILFAIIAFGYELFNFSLSIDEELFGLGGLSRAKEWLMNGRWGTYIFNLIFMPDAVLPYYPTLIALICIGLSAVVFLYDEKTDFKSKLIFAALFVSYPIHAYYLSFNVFNAAVGVGILLSMISFSMIRSSFGNNKLKIWLMVLAVPLLTFSFSIYQGLFSIFIIATFIYLFQQLIFHRIRFKDLLKRGVLFLLVYLLAFVLYRIIDYCFKHIFLPAAYFESAAYLDQFQGWKNLPFKVALGNLVHFISNYLFGNNPYGLKSMASIFLFLPILIIAVFMQIKCIKNKFVSLLLLAGIFISPFIVMIIAGSKIPPRALMGLAFLLAAIWFLGYNSIRSELLRKLIFAAAIFIFTIHTYHNTRLFYASNEVWKADREMASRIVERIHQLDIPKNQEKIEVALIGSYHPPLNAIFINSNTMGDSFFQHDNGNPNRILTFFRTMGINELQRANPNQLINIEAIIQTMPVWPDKDCVALVDGIVVVKLGEINKEN